MQIHVAYVLRRDSCVVHSHLDRASRLLAALLKPHAMKCFASRAIASNFGKNARTSHTGVF
jgi:hypothetical protein